MGSIEERKLHRTLLPCILILSLVFSIITLYAVPASGETVGTVTANNVRVRSNTDTSRSDNIVGYVYEGNRVTVLGSTKGKDGSTWYKIKLHGSGIEGYMSGSYLKIDKTEDNIKGRFGTVTANSVRVRSKADTSTSSNIVGYVNEGDRVAILGSTKGKDGLTWYQIELPNSKIKGYMSGYYLKLDEASDIDTQPLNDKQFEQALAKEGFPEAYKAELRKLHAKHPKWRFRALHTGIRWDDAVYRETNPVNRSLVSSDCPASWKSIEKGAYDPKTGKYTVFDSGGYVAASKAIVEHYMDPRNSLDDVTVFQFLSNTYDPSTQTLADVKSVVKGSFLDGKFPEPGYASYADLIMAAGRQHNVNPMTISSMIINEQGRSGKNGSVSGNVKGYEGYYNFLNVGAFAYGGSDAIINGLKYAKNQGWNSRVKSIQGGVGWYSDAYVKKNKYTLYLQRFNVMNGLNAVGTMQYMTAIWGANNEGISLSKGYKSNMEDGISFAIPVYLDMPKYPCPLPGKGDNLNYLKSLSVQGYNLTPTFSIYQAEYEVIVPNGVSSVTISALPESGTSKISGSGRYSLKVGRNPIKLICTSSSGNSRIYTVNVIRKSKPNKPVDPKPEQEVYPTSSVYKIGSELTGLTPKTSVAAFLGNFSKGTGSVRLFDASGKGVSSGYVKAGMVCKTYDSQGRLIKSMPVVLRGDADGDGQVNIKDCISILNHVVGRNKISKNLITSADANRDGQVNIKDSIDILNYVVGRSKLNF